MNLRTLPLTATILLALTTTAFAGGSHSHDHHEHPPATTQDAKPNVPTGDFSLVDSQGTTHTLSAYHGKHVVLEWVNFDCPFVKKHYRSGNMPALQEKYTAKGVVWLAVCSSAPGKQGQYEGQALTDRIAKEGFKGTAFLLDPEGTVGKLYDAKTTPHLYIFNPELDLIYNGAIDSIKSTSPDDIPKSTNYVEQVLDADMAGLPVPSPKTNPYGCSVKY